MNGLRRAVETKLFHPFSLAGAAALAALLLAPVPALAATITVNTTVDGAPANDGVCTLREAILAANTNVASGAMAGECAAGDAGLDTIAFAIPVAGVKTITPVVLLPAITEAIIIDGYTQPGSSPNTNAFPAPLNTVLLIELDGSTSGALRVNGPGSVIRGLNIHGGSDGIQIQTSGVTIAGNFVGTNPAGTSSFLLPSVGIRVVSGDNHVIGGAAAADRNLVSGYRDGSIEIEAGNGTLVQGNYVGTNVTGTASLQDLSASPFGVQPDPLTTNVSVLGNLISGNATGVPAYGGGAIIRGNLIGTQPDGVTTVSPIGNAVGVYLLGNGNVVGGTSAGQGNTIAFSSGEGIRVQPGIVGGNITGNSIFSNTRLGINLSGISGLTPLANDACDADTTPGNLGQNYPIITSAGVAAGNVTISGTLNSTASTTFRVEFFSNTACSSSGNGEGRTYLGFANVATNGTCDATFGPLVFAVPPGETVFTATATDPANNTSEFSACLAAGAPPTPTPTPTATATPTVAATPTPTVAATPTPTSGGPANASSVPALSEGMLAFLGLALVGAALALLKRGA